MNRVTYRALVLAVLGVSFVSVAVAEVWWANPAGGVFQVGANWEGNSPPTPGDRAAFNLPNSYTVQFIDDAQTAGLYASAGQITFDSQSWHYWLAGGVEVVNPGTSLSLLGIYEQSDGGFWLREGASLSVGGSFNKTGGGDFVVQSPNFSVGDAAHSSVEAGQVTVIAGAHVQLNNLTTHGDSGIWDAGSSLSLLGNYEQTDGGFDVRGGTSFNVAGSFNKGGGGEFVVESPNFSVGDVAHSSVEAGYVGIDSGAHVELNNLTTHWDSGVWDAGSSLSLLGNYEQTDGRFDVRGGTSFHVAGSFNKAGGGEFVVESPNFSVGDVAHSSVEAGYVGIDTGAHVELNNLTTHWDSGVWDAGSSLSLLGNYEQTDGRFDVRGGTSFHVAGSFNKVGGGEFVVESPNFSVGDVAHSSVEAGYVGIDSAAHVELNNLTTHWDSGVWDAGSSLSLSGNYEQTDGSFWLREGTSLNVAGSFNKAGALDFFVLTPNFSVGDAAHSSVEAGGTIINGGGVVELNNLTTHWDTNVQYAGSGLSLLGNYEQTDGSFWLREGTSLNVAGSFNKAGALDFFVLTPNFSVGDVAHSSVEAGGTIINGGGVVELNNLTTHWDTNVQYAGSSLSLSGNYEQTGGGFWLIDEATMTVDSSYTRVGAGYMVIGPDSVLQIGSTLSLGAGSEFHADGSVNVGQGPPPAHGLLRVGPGGTLAASGAVYSTVQVDGGAVSPGDPRGTLQVYGSLNQLHSGVLNLEIAGTTAGSDYDTLSVTGDLTLDGTVNVTFIDGFQPAAGDTFRLLTAGGNHSLSATWNFLNVPAGFACVTAWVGGGLNVTVVSLLYPAIQQQPTSTVVAEGGTAVFSVVAIGSDPLSYQWYHGTAPLSDDDRIGGARAAELTITAVTLADAGRYHVEVSNAYGTAVSEDAQLGVLGDFLWNNAEGGLFDDADNWLRGLAPDANSTPQFDLGVTTPYTVTFDGTAMTDQLRVGRDPVVFDMEGHTYTVGHNMTIGDRPGAQAGLTVIHGQLTNRYGSDPKLTRLATDPGSSAALVVSGTDAHIDAFDLRIGDGGAGSLRLDNGGRLDVDYCYAPNALNSTAQITVTDPYSQLVLIQLLALGYRGAAVADVLNGGYLNTTYFLEVGFNTSPEPAHLNISGSGSKATARWVYIGNSTSAGPTRGFLTLADGGRIEAGQTFTVSCNGRVTGNGTMAVPGALQNYGRLAPGSPLGVLVVEGGYTQYGAAAARPAARLEIDFGAGQNDQVQITGAANLSGTLALAALEGYVPPIGQSFTVLSAASVTGQFTALEETGLSSGVALEVLYEPGAVRAVARSIAGLSISPNPVSVYAGFGTRCAARAALNGGSPIDVSAGATWTSDDPSIATVQGGAVRGVRLGSTVIRTSFSGFTAAATVNVIAPPPSPLSRISVGLGGAEPNGNCFGPSLSADGRYVAFSSAATNLTASPVSGLRDVFVYDRQTNTTECASVDPLGGPSNGYSYMPVLSPDGRYVCFYSSATNLAAPATDGRDNIFIRDRVAQTTELVTLGVGGALADGYSYLSPSGDSVWSADGRYLVFYSYATNLVPGDTNGMADIFLFDRQLHGLSCVSTDSTGGPANDDSYAAALTPDGRYLLFSSYASNLVPADTNAGMDVFLKNLETGAVERVNLNADGSQMSNSNGLASMSADARYIAFEGPYPATVPQLFLRDRMAGTTTLLSVDDAGQPLAGSAYRPHITGDGRYVSFYSVAPYVESGVPGNGFRQVFLRDLQTGRNRLLSATPAHLPGDNDSSQNEMPAMAANGRYVAFSTRADDLVPYDTAGLGDIVLWDSALLLCRGDADCDGRVNFSDIDFFVAAIPDNQAAWAALYAARHGGAQPTCVFLNNDCSGDGHVNFADIDPFVALIPSACP